MANKDSLSLCCLCFSMNPFIINNQNTFRSDVVDKLDYVKQLTVEIQSSHLILDGL